MPGKIITDGDTITFDFSPLLSQGKELALTPPIPSINATGFATINKRKVCLSLDAETFVWEFIYTTPIYNIPGSGLIKITRATAALYMMSPSPMEVLVDSPELLALVTFDMAANSAESGPDPEIEPIPITGKFNPQNEFVSAQ